MRETKVLEFIILPQGSMNVRENDLNFIFFLFGERKLRKNKLKYN